MGALYVFVCGAGPAAEVDQLVQLAQNDGWDVYVGATPAGLEFLEVDKLAQMTGNEVRHTWSGRTSSWPPADAIVVAPATLNTIDKLAVGIADTWVVNTLIECMGLGIPIVMAANVNPALGRHPRFRQNVDELRSWGVAVLWEANPMPPRWIAPWADILSQLPRGS